MASPEAETFLWRRILKDERVNVRPNSALLEAWSESSFNSRFAALKRFYATIFVKRLFNYRATAGQRLHTDQNLLSVALLGSDC